jgi:hypothetical protein
LTAIVECEGVITDSPHGRRANPALIECRQQELKLARLMRVLKLEFGEQDQCRLVSRRARIQVIGA